MPKDDSLHLTKAEITQMFSEGIYADRFPPIMSLDEAADMLRVSKDTLRDWRSRGLLSGCCRKVGKHLRFTRDRLIKKVFNDGLHSQ
ncbi:helix-turn-helix domain-containing protein [Rubinisphaera sp.]|uniref:helix-turn-helix domain-containing protein n=1 Tax=Rubinisphaera sp. TaxID=2024857 RepID=UPI000C107C07|nr:helix-turn-helix domain-containing protein [Rubinisphaera sp.]MBV08100.1 DNA-binding protein [Rubinisphaera sp.]|tara:strand:+ start:1301 stop:1561 length:261 start_codon:yes stop_codon:yes gene_type:complete